MAMRIALQGRQISEIETVMGRSGLGTAGPAGGVGAKNLEAMGKPDDIWFKDIPAAERASREDVIRVSNMYFSNPAEQRRHRPTIRSSPTTATGWRMAARQPPAPIPRRDSPRPPARLPAAVRTC